MKALNELSFINRFLVCMLTLVLLTGCFQAKEYIDVEHTPQTMAELTGDKTSVRIGEAVGSEVLSGGTIIEKKDDLVKLHIKYHVKDLGLDEESSGNSFDPIGGLIDVITHTLAGLIMTIGGSPSVDIEPVSFDIPDEIDEEVFKFLKINKVIFKVTNSKEENKDYVYNLRFMKKMELELSSDEIEENANFKRIPLAKYKRKTTNRKELQQIEFDVNQGVDLMQFLANHDKLILYPLIKIGDIPKKGLKLEGIIDFTLSIYLPF